MKTPAFVIVAPFLAAVASVEAVVARARQGSAASIDAMASRRFGPQNCVLVDRLSSGSCVLRTDCHGLDTSSMEFSFDCWAPNGDIFRHAYGKGGFGEKEDFDTEVQCAQCHPPAQCQDAPKKSSSQAASKASIEGTVSFAKKKAGAHPVVPLLSPFARAAGVVARTEENYTKVAKVTGTAPQYAGGMGDLATQKHIKAGPAVSMYGPKSCVSTWRSAEGHCVLQTACEKVDIASYEFGLVCVDAKGGKTKHSFGRGSFDNVETFDTLAECSECIGLDDQRAVALRVQKRRWKASAEANEVATLSEEVKTLTQGMTTMLSAVVKLRQKVKDEKKPTPAPSVVATVARWNGEDTPDDDQTTPVAAATPRLRSVAAAVEKQPRVAAQVKEERRKRHHHHRRVVEEEEDDDDDDDNDSDEDGEESDGKKKESNMAEGFDEEHLTPATNGVGEVLGEDSEAEASELAVASDGEASAGMMDDGSSSLAAAW